MRVGLKRVGGEKKPTEIALKTELGFRREIEADLLKEMAMRQFYNEIRGLKVKELPNYVKPMMSVGYIKKAIERGLDKYHAKYIQTSSVEPLYHVCFGGMALSYLIALPEERRHLEHQQHAHAQ